MLYVQVTGARHDVAVSFFSLYFSSLALKEPAAERLSPVLCPCHTGYNALCTAVFLVQSIRNTQTDGVGHNPVTKVCGGSM